MNKYDDENRVIIATGTLNELSKKSTNELGQGNIGLYEVEKDKFMIVVHDQDDLDGEPFFTQEVANNMGLRESTIFSAITWTMTDGKGLRQLSFTFDNKFEFGDFVKEMKQILEKEDEKLMKRFEEMNLSKKLLKPAIQSPKKSPSETSTKGKASQKPQSLHKNSEAADSYNYERMFVVQGPAIDVYTSGTDEPKYLTTLSDLRSLTGTSLKPKSILLYQKDNNMLCLNDKGGVCNIDINQGKVVSEWAAAKDVPVRALAPLDKFAPRTGETVFSAIGDQAVFSMDPREPGREKAINLEYCTYKTKMDFTSFGTSKSGGLAVGGGDGVIRLYTGTPGCIRVTKGGTHPKLAMCLLAGKGDPIKAIEVSGDSEWVLATCDKYLMLYHTMIGDRSLFEYRVSEDKKPEPIILKPGKITLDGIGGIGNLHLNPGRFDVNPKGETRIVSSSGNYLLRWNLDEIKRNGVSVAPKVKAKANKLIDTQFVVNKDLVPKLTPVICIAEDKLLYDISK